MTGKIVSEQEIFDMALTLGVPEAREAYLQQVCGENRELRQRVDALLDAFEKDPRFLETPLTDFGAAATTGHAVSERPGTQIGPYRLLEPLGEGGMGVVWSAEQQEPVRRQVALKLIKPGMDTRRVLARFDVERQALALMEHPNIARVLDAGATESGRPYFVMELVMGQPITKYCDERQLTPRQRLELLLPVCQAIQHAHQKGIIHRDIKPTNELIAEIDQRPVPKVIDFGVAKAIGQTLTEKSSFTESGQIVGTLEYMSPEQARINQHDIDTQSDIYSLGVLLYELLTGTTPFDRKRLLAAAWDEMLRIIREEDPPKPSQRLTDAADSLPSVSALRHLEPARLTKLVRGELDWIAMKALERDRNRRYATVNAFAADVQRFLNEEPVQAGPPSAWYRFRKFAQRNRGVLSAAALVSTAIIVAVIGWGALIVKSYQYDADVAAEREKVSDERTKAAEERAIAANEREKKTRRDSLMQQLQHHLRSEHNAGWSVKGWATVREIAQLRRDRDLRDAAAATLLGIDATSKTIDFQPEELAYDPTGKQLLMTQVVPADPNGPAGFGLHEVARIWDSVSGETRDLPQRPHDAYGPIAYRSDGTPLQLVWDKAEESRVLVWNMLEQKAFQQLECAFALGASPSAWSLTRDGRFAGGLVIDAGGNRLALVWETESGMLLGTIPTKATDLEVCPDGSLVATSDKEGNVEVWSLTKNVPTAPLRSGHAAISCMAWRRDSLLRIGASDSGWLLAVGSSGGDLTIWDVDAKVPRSFCRGSAHDVSRLVFSPDGMTLASVGRDSPMLWDVTTGRLLLSLGVRNYMTCVAFSPDGAAVAVGSKSAFGDTGGVDVWDLYETRGQQVLRGLLAEVRQVALSRDNRYVAALAQNWQLAIWDVAQHRLLHIFETPKGLFAEGDGLAFDFDGRRIAFASKSDARVWDVATGQELLSLSLQAGFQNRLAFHGPNRLFLIRQESIDPQFLPYGRNPDFRESPRACRLYDLLASTPTEPIREIADFPEGVMWIEITSEGSHVAIEGLQSNGEERTRVIKLVELPDGHRWPIFTSHPTDAHMLQSFEPRGTFLLMHDLLINKKIIVDVATRERKRVLSESVAALSPESLKWVVWFDGTDAVPAGYSLVDAPADVSQLTLGGRQIEGQSIRFSLDCGHLAWGNDQGQRQLTLCASEGFDEEIEVPGTTATFHDEAAFARMLLEER